MREKVILICDTCLSRNYHFTKKAYAEKKLVLNKFCPHCNCVTQHSETR
ncbi:MAG: 50S ribosomal protein L33 [Mycoplasmataceae bacterium]|nr:50S ribosomal protein L33 [Mycoplasmataceae bacterium]